MKSQKIAILIACSVLLLGSSAVYAHNTGAKHAHRGSNYEAPQHQRYAPNAYINGSPVYIHAHPVYGYRYHRYPQHQTQNLNLPSTHIHGAYPYKKPSTTIRINPHSSSIQKKHLSGNGTYGYNHYSRRGNGRWYR